MPWDPATLSFLGALIGGGVAGTIASAALLKRNTQLEARIRSDFSAKARAMQSTREWKEKTLSELLGPMVMHLHRTQRGFLRYTQRNDFLEAKVIREGNMAIRDLLLVKGHLIPPGLVNAAVDLIEHYDRWLEEFEVQRGAQRPDGSSFVFTGPAGFPFPTDAEALFKNEFSRLQSELYDVNAP